MRETFFVLSEDFKKFKSRMFYLINRVQALETNTVTGSGTVTAIWSGSQAEYDALTPEEDTLYIII